jgi:chromosomal replication initiator protein
MNSAENIWKSVLGQLQITVAKSCYTTWFADTKGISYDNGVFVIGVKDDFTATSLRQQYIGLIERTLFKFLEGRAEIQFTVDWDPSKPAKKNEPELCALYNLNPDLSFENFVVGPCNALAHAAAVQAANGSKKYNPLFICATPGLGKTHLLQAIGQRSVENNMRPIYTSCSALVTECIESFSSHTTVQVEEKYASADVLMVDDIHNLAGKSACQDIFFNIFNSARDAGHQIVVTSDRTPDQMEKIDSRLKSRLEWGLMTDMQIPEYETRKAILKAYSIKRELDVPDDVIDYIAEEECDNIRQLEGRMNKVQAYAALLNSPITQELARQALNKIAGKSPRVANAVSIINDVAREMNVSPDDIIGSSKEQKVALARQISMYVLKQAGVSLTSSGRILGNRTPSTVSHGIDKIGNIIASNQEIRSIVDKVLANIVR